ncbi:serine/threonine-protein kinase [Daejeonella sp.]|uniref:serine/threonine-protein kinase n=1 Tax=Daejeonella sp. TaxID=2805397 RepID=UPI0030C44FA1
MSKVFTITEGLENLGAFRTGGQGSVYKGKRTGAIITAVKLLPTPIIHETKENKNFRDFINEVEKLKKVNEDPSPNVVKILSSGLTDSGSFPFIEMEFIDGDDLEELLKTPHDPIFKLKEVIRVTEQLANALAHVHSVNVKHGDIKSNNVKYNAYTGNYVLLDFGLAVMSDEQRRTSLRQAGAIEFMAPEQYEGQMLFQSDIYSYGVVLYELLAGQVPFPLFDNGETARNNVRVSHIETPLPNVLELRKRNLPETWSEEQKMREMRVPQWLLVLLDKCLQKKPSRRFSNGIELQEFIFENSISQAQINHSADTDSDQKYQQIIAEKDLKISTLRRQLKTIKYSTRSSIKVPAPLFFVTLILFSGLLLFAGYNFFTQDPSTAELGAIKGGDTSQVSNTNNISPSIAKALPPPVILDIDSIKDSELSKKENEDSLIKQSGRTDEEQTEPPKKKKRFLEFLFKKKREN